MENVFVRQLKENDIPVLRSLAITIWPPAFHDILSKEQIDYMLQMMYSKEVLQQELERGVDFFFLIKDDEPVGYTAIEKVAPVIYKLHKIYLSPAYHGRGLGKFQLKMMEGKAADRGGDFLRLNVNRYNKAVGFYQSQGYRIIQKEDNDIGNGFFMNDYVMEKKL